MGALDHRPVMPTALGSLKQACLQEVGLEVLQEEAVGPRGLSCALPASVYLPGECKARTGQLTLHKPPGHSATLLGAKGSAGSSRISLLGRPAPNLHPHRLGSSL